jgi:hypothetical protein
MAFLQFPSVLLIKTFDTAEIVNLGSFKLSESGELEHIQSWVYIKGTPAGNERIRLRVHTTSDTSRVYAQSDWVAASDLGANFLGWVRFDFSLQNMNKNFFYWISAETQNYTRNADTLYFGITYDYPFPTYTTGVSDPSNYTDYPLATKIFVVKPRNI